MVGLTAANQVRLAPWQMLRKANTCRTLQPLALARASAVDQSPCMPLAPAAQRAALALALECTMPQRQLQASQSVKAAS